MVNLSTQDMGSLARSLFAFHVTSTWGGDGAGMALNAVMGPRFDSVEPANGNKEAREVLT